LIRELLGKEDQEMQPGLSDESRERIARKLQDGE
jgi:hypothetical protein